MTDTSDTTWTTRTHPWDRLRWARERAKMNQEKMADLVNLGRTAYRKYEVDPAIGDSSQINYQYARIWAKHLKVRFEWLMGENVAPWPPTPGEAIRDALDGLASKEDIEHLAGLAETVAKKSAASG